MSNTLMEVTSFQLRRAIKIKARIEGFERELQNLLQITGSRGSYNTKGARRGPMSAAAKARIIAAQKKRWAKWRKEQGSALTANSIKRKGLSDQIGTAAQSRANTCF